MEAVQVVSDSPLWAEGIKRWRVHNGWTQDELARRLNSLPGGHVCDGNQVSRWERAVQSPKQYEDHLCVVFEQSIVDSAETMPLDRREFVRHALGLGVLSLGIPGDVRGERIAHAVAGLGAVDKKTVDGLELVTVNLHGLQQQVGPLELVGAVLGHFGAVQTLLKRSVPSSLRPRLASVAAETAGMLAVAKAQAGEAAEAKVCIATSLRLCRESGDRALGAWYMGEYTAAHPDYRALPELRLKHFTRGAFGFSPQEATVRARGWFAAKAADIHAQRGEALECERALQAAETVCMGPASSERPESVICGLDERWLAAERASSLARLGRSDLAAPALREALRLVEPDFGRASLWLLLAQARTHAHAREPEEAALVAGDVHRNARDVHFELVSSEVRRFYHDELSGWGSVPAVQALGDQLAS